MTTAAQQENLKLKEQLEEQNLRNINLRTELEVRNRQLAEVQKSNEELLKFSKQFSSVWHLLYSAPSTDLNQAITRAEALLEKGKNT